MTSTSLVSELDILASEGRNADTMNLDTMSTSELVEAINKEDKKVPDAVALEASNISAAIDAIVEKLANNGRLIYVGAGTSGRLGVLDAVECPPTFSVDHTQVLGLIAGGSSAFLNAIEGAEDNTALGKQDLVDINLTNKDVVMGIAASGRTPYVIGALTYATQIGAQTVSLTCNKGAPLSTLAHINICVAVGPECLTGSTRMKAGTAQKLVLNTISTSVFVKLGKVYQNLMVDVSTSNKKLRARAKRIVMQATQCSESQASEALEACSNNVKAAILMRLLDIDAPSALAKINKENGYIRRALVN